MVDGGGPIILNTSIRLRSGRLRNKSCHSDQVIAVTRLRRLAATIQQSFAIVMDSWEGVK